LAIIEETVLEQHHSRWSWQFYVS